MMLPPPAKHFSLLGFIALATAQSTVDVFGNIFMRNDTLTLHGSDATATTYGYTCTPKASSSSALPSNWRIDDAIVCPTYTVFQGPSSYSFHLAMASSFPFKWDVGCTWSGALREADLTCAGTMNIDTSDNEDMQATDGVGVETTTMLRGEVEGFTAPGGVRGFTIVTPAAGAAKETGVKETGAKETGAKETGEKETGAIETARTKTSEGLGAARATGGAMLMGGAAIGVLGAAGVFL